MREIKFRCVANNNVVHNKAIMNKSPISHAFTKTVFNKGEHIVTPLDDWEQSLMWEQFTGLTDCNGKDIYEGDIFEVFIGSLPMPVIGKVVESEGCFIIEYEEFDKPTSVMLYWFLRNGRKVIIGNIHQNPEVAIKLLSKSGEEYTPFNYNDDLVGKVIKSNKPEGVIKHPKLMIIKQSINEVVIGDYGGISYHSLLDNFMFLDGSECGKLE